VPGAIPFVGGWLGRTLAAADVRFAVSRFTADKVEKLAGATATFVGSGVAVDTFVPQAAARSNPKPVIGCVSRFVPRKGQERVIEAVAKLDRDVQLLIVGKGRTEARIRKKAAALGVDARFEIDVPWSELAGLYQQMDIFVMPCKSRWGGLEVEGLGLVFLEAAACGVPVVAGNSGGSPETVVEGETGFVATEVPEIVVALETLLDDPERAAEMGRAGRDFVMDTFTFPRVVERMRDGFAPHLR
jgi:phosphatidylinositol alpha-1,6-mannosyltransferase